MFEELGGFDDLYGRFYLEDLDLCYRAWKRGWTCLIEPKSRVIHETAGTIGKILSEEEIQQRQWRNRFLFTWKNLHSRSLMTQHFLLTPLACAVLPFMKKKVFTLGFLEALRHFGEAWQKRKGARREARVSDKAVLKRVGIFRAKRVR
jgi:GT2 family glycosyltransferase